jgi:hypothetical protein
LGSLSITFGSTRLDFTVFHLNTCRSALPVLSFSSFELLSAQLPFIFADSFPCDRTVFAIFFFARLFAKVTLADCIHDFQHAWSALVHLAVVAPFVLIMTLFHFDFKLAGQYFLLVDKTVDNKPVSYPINPTFTKKSASLTR